MHRYALGTGLAVVSLVASASAQITPLQLGEAQDGTIEMTGQSDFFRLELPAPGELVVQVSNAGQTGERYAVYIKKGGLPSPTDYLAASEADGVEQLLDVQGADAGTYYVQVLYSSFSGNYWQATGEYRILARPSSDLPLLRMGEAQKAVIPMVGQSHYYQLDLGSLAELVVLVSNAGQGGERYAVYIKKGRLPSPADHLAVSDSDAVEQILDIADASSGTYYVQVLYSSFSGNYWQAAGEYRILARRGGDLPLLAFGEATAATIPMVGQSHYYRLTLSSPVELVAQVSNAGQTGERFAVYIKKDGLPSPADHLAASEADGVEQLLDVPGASAGTYYVQVRYSSFTGNYWQAAGEYRIVWQILGSAIAQVRPSQVGNAGMATLTILGAGLQDGATVSLVRAGQPDIVPLETTRISQSQVRARFDLRGTEPGLYDLVMSGPEGSATAPEAVEIIEGGEPELWVQMVGPTASRLGRPTRYQLRYGNSGTVDAHGAWLLLRIPGGFGAKVNVGGVWQAVSQVGEATGAPASAALAYVSRIPCATSQRISIALTAPAGVQSAEIGGTVTESLVDVLPQYVCWSEAPAGSAMLPGAGKWLGGRASDGFLGWTIRAHAEPLDPGKRSYDHVLLHLGGDRAGHIFFGGSGEVSVSALMNGGIVVGGYRLTYVSMKPAPPGVSLENIERNWQEFRSHPWEYDPDARGKGTNARSCVSVPVFGYWPDGNLPEELGTGGVSSSALWRYLGPEEVAVARYVGRVFMSTAEILWQALLRFIITAAIDPNDKFGPTEYQGESEQNRYAAADHAYTYVVQFENLEKATAAAQEVLVIDQLGPDLDWSTFSMGGMQIGDAAVEVPDGTFNHDATVDLRPELTALVDITFTFDPATGRAEWLMRGRDPDTGELADFLPPNTAEVDPRGRGWVSYAVSPKPDLPTGTVIRNTATIDFEVGIPPEPLETPEWINTIDAGGPTSGVQVLADTQSTAGFEVSWSGEDDDGGSGIRDYTIYVADDGGDYEVWLANTADTSATFTGEDGHSYEFYSRATDNVGHVEPAPDGPDTATRVDVAADAHADDDAVDDDQSGQVLPPVPATCGACGTGAPLATILSCVGLGLEKRRRQRR